MGARVLPGRLIGMGAALYLVADVFQNADPLVINELAGKIEEAGAGDDLAADGLPAASTPSGPRAQQNADKPGPKSEPVGVCLPPATGIAPVRVWRGVNVHPR